MITKEQKAEITAKYGNGSNDTGSPDGRSEKKSSCLS